MTENKNLYLKKIQLKAELERCLNCPTQPCMSACPVNCNPQEFINHAKGGNYGEAVKSITRYNPMGQTCGLICPDKFCMNACTRSHIDFAINIPKVQATILENFRNAGEDYSQIEPQNKKVAVIGAGPAGIAAAASLAKFGYEVTIFEASGKIGGALNMIPEKRLPHDVIEKDWQFLCHDGFITLKLNTVADNIGELLQEFDGVIAAIGEQNGASLNIPGEENCLSYRDYLQAPEKFKTQGRVAIIGGGNVAADCTFTAKHLGAESVEMFVRRRLSDMKVTKHEFQELLKHEIDINTMTSPDRVEAVGEIYSLFVHKNRFAEGRVTALPESTIKLPDYNLIIKAIGSYAGNKLDDERIIYAGDCLTGGSTIVEAIASGRFAARQMNAKLSGISKV